MKPDAETTAFNAGYVLACCNLVHLHDEPTIAWDVLAELGVTRAEIRRMNLTDFDLKALRKIERENGRGSPYADGRKRRRKAVEVPA